MPLVINNFSQLQSLFFVTVMLCMVCDLHAQTEALLQYQWTDTVNVEPNRGIHRFNEVWGFSQGEREYGVIGSTMGTHFIDISNADTLREAAFVRGKFYGQGVVHRDFHDYKGYLYGVCDQGSSSLQVIDLGHLPDSVSLVHEDSVNILNAHNVFIDSARARMYTCGVRLPNGQGRVPIQVWSLSDPVRPQLIKNVYEIEELAIDYVHDIYARNDTVFINAARQGLIIAHFFDASRPQLLGVMGNYQQKGYNHSGWWNESGDYYFMADETFGQDLKVVDVTDIASPHVVHLFEAESDPEASIPHNLIVKNNRIYVSYYADGLQIFDFSKESIDICRSFSYATSRLDPRRGTYPGAWGVYPLLPSKRILVSDRQNGLFVIRLPEEITASPYDGDGTPPCEILSNQQEDVEQQLRFVHAPSRGIYQLIDKELDGHLSIWNTTGQLQFDSFVRGQQVFDVPVDQLVSGMYFMSYEAPEGRHIFKFYIY